MSDLAPVADENGLPTSGWLESLSPRELRGWVEKRLAGIDPWFPLREGDEARHELVLHFCRSRALRDPRVVDIARVVTALAEERVCEDRPDPETFRETLALFGSIVSCRPTDKLLGALDHRRFDSASWRESELDLALLSSLSWKAGSLPPEFWTRFLDSIRTIEIALAAVQDALGWMEAARELVPRIGIFRRNAGRVDLALSLDYLLRGATAPREVAEFFSINVGDPNDRAFLASEWDRLGARPPLSSTAPLISVEQITLALRSLAIKEPEKAAEANRLRSISRDPSYLTQARSLDREAA